MKKYFKNPYVVTSLIFLALILVGRALLYWGERDLAFILLLYFIVTLGIRLDDISKQLGSGHDRPTQIPDDESNVIGRLGEINSRLSSIDETLKKISAIMEKEERSQREE